MVYFFMIVMMVCVSLIGPVEYVRSNIKDKVYIILSFINMVIPVILYLMVYYYGMENYNNKRLFASFMIVIFLILLIGQYLVLLKENRDGQCKYLYSSRKYNNVKDTIYRFMYFLLMMIIPFYLQQSSMIMSWALVAPILIPIFLYGSSFILGLGVSDGNSLIDAGDYYNAFIRGIDKDESYIDKGLTINILRSIVRTVILIALFVISFLVSKRVANTDHTTPYSIFIFMITISSILPIILGYFLEPKCLLKQAKDNKNKGDNFVCYVFDKHGGIYVYLIYVLVCGLIIISKDN